MHLRSPIRTALGAAVTALVFGALPAAAENPSVTIQTSKGAIKVELFADKAPVTVENFLGYVDDGFYTGTTFHRVIPDFMIQGGGMSPDMKKKDTKPAIVNEADNELKNERGTLAMARTNDKDSATSQFFINLKYNRALDHGARGFGYAVFGKVIGGMDVVDAIAAVKTGNQGRHQNVPVDPVLIEKITRD